jgi:methylmalonyl-CoA epimerase
MTERVLDHVGIAVPALDAAIPIWEAIVGAPATDRESVDTQGVEVVFIGAGPGRIELVAPTRSDSAVTRFLERGSKGMHHLCYRVENITAALPEWESAGFDLIDRQPRPGAAGHLIAFLHPRTSTGALIELLQHAAPGEQL